MGNNTTTRGGRGRVFCGNNLLKPTMMTNDHEKTQMWGVRRKGVVFCGVHL